MFTEAQFGGLAATGSGMPTEASRDTRTFSVELPEKPSLANVLETWDHSSFQVPRFLWSLLGQSKETYKLSTGKRKAFW